MSEVRRGGGGTIRHEIVIDYLPNGRWCHVRSGSDREVRGFEDRRQGSGIYLSAD